MIELKIAPIVAAALCLSFAPAFAQAGLNDLEVAHSAYTADVIDIDYANIALAKSKNEEVRKFAELMIRDHTAVNEGAGALLAKLGAKAQDNAFSKALLAGAATKKAELSKLDGVAFDRAYAANELAYHKTVNAIVGDTWIPAIKTPELKVFLTQALATFRVHEDHANHMTVVLK